VRDSDAVLIIADPKGLTVSEGTRYAHAWADHYGKYPINRTHAGPVSLGQSWSFDIIRAQKHPVLPRM
jgi:hypothetical protein